MKYKKKTVVIEAVQFNGRNFQEIADFTQKGVAHRNIYIEIETLEGTMKANINDYIIKGIQGEFHPCKPDIFKETYETVEE